MLRVRVYTTQHGDTLTDKMYGYSPAPPVDASQQPPEIIVVYRKESDNKILRLPAILYHYKNIVGCR